MLYLIQTVHFDSSENSTANAEFTVDVGFLLSKESVDRYIAKNKLESKKKWNGKYYPYYKVTEIEELAID